MSDQAKFMLNEINEIKDYFHSEIQEGKAMSKKLSKYIAPFNYIDEILIVLSATSREMSVISFASAISVPVGIGSASFNLVLIIIIYINNLSWNNKEIIKHNQK